MVMYRVCSDCNKAYLYIDSPPADRCFCGKQLEEPTEEEYIDCINRKIDVNYPTVSC